LSPLRYLACVLAVTAACLTAAWTFADRMGMAFLESGYPVVLAKRRLIDRCQAGELVVLGDSRGEASIIPTRLPVLSANLAIGAIGPVEAYFIARKLLRCPQPPRVVLYVPSIVGYEGLGEGLWQRAAKYGLVSYADLREIANAATTLHDPSVEDVSTGDGLTGWVRDLAYSLHFPSIFTSSAIDARLFGRYESNLRVLKAVTESRGHVVYPDGPGGTIVGADAKLEHFDPKPIGAYYFDATLHMLSDAGIRTIVLPIPVADATAAALRPEVKQDVVRYVAGHTNGVAHVTDAFTEVEAWPDRLFVDGSHMNKAGATLFSERLAGCVAAWLHDRAATCDMTWRDEASQTRSDRVEKPSP
jgi:hypothetical protein